MLRKVVRIPAAKVLILVVSSTRTRARRSLLGGVLLCALAACGTTVPLQSQGGSAGSGLNGTTGDLVTGDGSSGTTTSGGAETSTGSTPGTPGSTTGSGSSPAAGGGSGTTGTTGTTGTSTTTGTTAGGTKAPVRIGFTTVPDAAAFFASFGASSSNVDQAAMVKNAVKWVNAHGGLNGHPIQAYIEEVSATSQEPYDSQYQKLCTKFTQDDKVIAAGMVGIGANTNMDVCMSKAKTLFVTGANTLHDESDYVRAPFVVSPQEVTAPVLAKALAQLVLTRSGEKKGGKVGLLSYDVAEYNRAVDQQLKPILAAAGISLVQYKIPAPQSTAGIGSSVSVVQSAQLKMAAQGVKTVTALCGGCMPFFIQAANGQGYYPRYFLSSLDTPGAADGSTYERALRTSVSIGWEPNADYGSTPPPAPVQHSATYDQCYKIQKAAGYISDSSSTSIAIITCDEVLALYHAAQANPVEPMTSTSLRDGLLALGTSHPSALSFATNLTPQKHAGASHYKLMTWNDTCSCPAYSGGLVPFPSL